MLTLFFCCLVIFFIYFVNQELIQNADDGKATKVFFILDERSYGTEKLWKKDLGKYQGIHKAEILHFSQHIRVYWMLRSH